MDYPSVSLFVSSCRLFAVCSLSSSPCQHTKAKHVMMLTHLRSAAGDEVVVEEFMTGPEISVFALSDGYSTVLLPAAQDHKKVGEGDTVCVVAVATSLAMAAHLTPLSLFFMQ